MSVLLQLLRSESGGWGACALGFPISELTRGDVHLGLRCQERAIGVKTKPHGNSLAPSSSLCFRDQLQQHHLETCEKCSFWGPTQTRCLRHSAWRGCGLTVCV